MSQGIISRCRKCCCINIWERQTDRQMRRIPASQCVLLLLSQNSHRYSQLNTSMAVVAGRLWFLLNYSDLSKKGLWDFVVPPEKGVQEVGQASLIQNKHVGGLNYFYAYSLALLCTKQEQRGLGLTLMSCFFSLALMLCSVPVHIASSPIQHRIW